MIAKAFNLDQNYILPGKFAYRKDLIRRPLDMSLSNKKMKHLLEIDSISIEDSIQELKNEKEIIREKIYNSTLANRPDVICYGKQFICSEDVEALLSTINDSFLTQGPKIPEFENNICKYTGAKYAVAVGNWTQGLLLSCLAAGIKKGDAIITSPNSFCASANCGVYVGATPLFADIDSNTLNIDPQKVREAFFKI